MKRQRPGDGKIVQEHTHGDGKPCRCKEVAKKTPLQLVKMMIDDLAFWRKKDSKSPKN